MNEFIPAMTEAFGVLAEQGGETWIVKTTGATFRGIQSHSEGSFDVIVGSRKYKREVNLSCVHSDFNGAYLPKLTIVYRQMAPNVLYFVKGDSSVENATSPTFVLMLELKV